MSQPAANAPQPKRAATAVALVFGHLGDRIGRKKALLLDRRAPAIQSTSLGAAR